MTRGLPFALILLALTGCAAAGDPLGWRRPEELVTICHVEQRPDGYGDYYTRTYSRSRAEWHLDNCLWDYLGECAP